MAGELNNRFPGFVDLVFHTAAEVKNKPYRKRRIFLRKVADLLLALPLEHLKIVTSQGLYQAVVTIRNGHRYQDQVDVYFHQVFVTAQFWRPTGCDRWLQRPQS